jgi:hypothetical protein
MDRMPPISLVYSTKPDAMKLACTPHDGLSKPFMIGLRQLDPARRVEPDAEFVAALRKSEATPAVLE